MTARYIVQVSEQLAEMGALDCIDGVRAIEAGPLYDDLGMRWRDVVILDAGAPPELEGRRVNPSMVSFYVGGRWHHAEISGYEVIG